MLKAITTSTDHDQMTLYHCTHDPIWQDMPCQVYDLINHITFGAPVAIAHIALNKTELFFHKTIHNYQYFELANTEYLVVYPMGWIPYDGVSEIFV